MHIPFNKPYMSGKELFYIAQAHANAKLAGDGPFTEKCKKQIELITGVNSALLTHSCTAALEIAALLLDIEPGDEIIMPSYTFVSTANAFVLRGGVPVFVDIRPDTLNINEALIEAVITPRTRAIAVVHYAGVPCEMNEILRIAQKYQLKVVEDAAQGFMSTYHGAPLGGIGDLGAFSFHETKNIISGEGGALLVNDFSLIERAEIIREKGTNRKQFFRGIVDKYTWQEVGSSYLPGEIIAAFLWAQLEEARSITDKRLAIWNVYHQLLASSEERGLLRRPIILDGCQHNGHMYYVLLPKSVDRQRVIDALARVMINTVFHYAPLHSAPAGLQLGKTSGPMDVTNDVAERILRLPLWVDITHEEQEKVCGSLLRIIENMT
ncbi:dTDP-4-amino-4,6-dideoxygalactose transaminase [Polynucleobacter wuianus]|uniref:dTDP-4-amino-4,6-dideoxygalactose transaminase n=1 Tax=Polynucleobacter wuianus TaxID=1743168 RepID=A0A191UI51_9BURK|nr:dTDP-4-amino-4,6-dideoxygalactose transaminase [Polynucleobacter wuianus]